MIIPILPTFCFLSWQANAKDGLLNVSDLMLESEPMTDVEESLPRLDFCSG